VRAWPRNGNQLCDVCHSCIQDSGDRKDKRHQRL